MSDATLIPYAAARPAPAPRAVAIRRAPRRPVDWAGLRETAAAALRGAGDALILVVAVMPSLFVLAILAEVMGWHVF